jgi:hypothetical protein
MSELRIRRYDGYIADTEEKEPGEVVFLGPARVVICERFKTFAEWDAERRLPVKSGDESRRVVGIAPDGNRPGVFILDGSDTPSPDKTLFYGVDHV